MKRKHVALIFAFFIGFIVLSLDILLYIDNHIVWDGGKFLFVGICNVLGTVEVVLMYQAYRSHNKDNREDYYKSIKIN
jgi:hypothetical protein